MLQRMDYFLAVGEAAKPPTRDGGFEAGRLEKHPTTGSFLKKAENPHF